MPQTSQGENGSLARPKSRLRCVTGWPLPALCSGRDTLRSRLVRTGLADWKRVIAIVLLSSATAPAEEHDATVRNAEPPRIVVEAESAAVRCGVRPLRHGARVLAVAIDEESNQIVSFGKDMTVRWWDLQTGRPMKKYRLAREAPLLISAAALNEDATQLALAPLRGTPEVWDVERGERLLELGCHKSWVNSLTFSNDGRLLASADCDGVSAVWDVANGSHQVLRDRPTALGGWRAGAIRRTAFSGDGKRIAAVTKYREMLVWNIADGFLITRFRISSAPEATYVAFSAKGDVLFTNSYYGIGMWDTKTGQLLHDYRLVGHKNFSRAKTVSVTLPSDGKRLVAIGEREGQIRVLDLEKRRELFSLSSPPSGPGAGSDWLTTLDMSADGATLVTGSASGTLYVWDLLKRRPRIDPGNGHHSVVRALAFSNNDSRLISGGRDGTIRVWDTQSGRQSGILACPAPVNAMALLSEGPDTCRIAIASDAPQLLIFDLGLGRMTQRLAGSTVRLMSVAATPDGKRVLAGNYQGIVHMWTLDEAGEYCRWRGNERKDVHNMALSADGRRLMLATQEQFVPILDIGNGTLAPISGPRFESAPLCYVTPGRCQCAQAAFLAGTRSSVSIWMPRPNVSRTFLPAPHAPMSSFAHSSDGMLLATGHDDGTVTLWEVVTGGRIVTFEAHTQGVGALAFSASGGWLATASAIGDVAIWNLFDPKLHQHAAAGSQPEGLSSETALATLGSRDPAEAFATVARLIAAGAKAEELLSGRLRPLEDADLPDLLKSLDSTNFKDRSRAEAEFASFGWRAQEMLTELLSQASSEEVRVRLRRALTQIDSPTVQSERVRTLLRAILVLRTVNTPNARKTLKRWAAGPAFSRVTLVAKQATARLMTQPLSPR